MTRLFTDHELDQIAAAQELELSTRRAAGLTIDVTFVGDDPADDAIDHAYCSKYARYPAYVEPMISEQARASTLKLLPEEQP